MLIYEQDTLYSEVGRSTYLEVCGIYDTPAWVIFRWIDKIRGEGVSTHPRQDKRRQAGLQLHTEQREPSLECIGGKRLSFLFTASRQFPTALVYGAAPSQFAGGTHALRTVTPTSNSLRCDKGRAPALARGCGWVGLAGGLIGGWVLSNGDGMRGNNRSTGRRDLSLPSY